MENDLFWLHLLLKFNAKAFLSIKLRCRHNLSMVQPIKLKPAFFNNSIEKQNIPENSYILYKSNKESGIAIIHTHWFNLKTYSLL